MITKILEILLNFYLLYSLYSFFTMVIWYGYIHYDGLLIMLWSGRKVYINLLHCKQPSKKHSPVNITSGVTWLLTSYLKQRLQIYSTFPNAVLCWRLTTELLHADPLIDRHGILQKFTFSIALKVVISSWKLINY